MNEKILETAINKFQTISLGYGIVLDEITEHTMCIEFCMDDLDLIEFVMDIERIHELQINDESIPTIEDFECMTVNEFLNTILK